jgi:hypothetical protein
VALRIQGLNHNLVVSGYPTPGELCLAS